MGFWQFFFRSFLAVFPLSPAGAIKRVPLSALLVKLSCLAVRVCGSSRAAIRVAVSLAMNPLLAVLSRRSQSLRHGAISFAMNPLLTASLPPGGLHPVSAAYRHESSCLEQPNRLLLIALKLKNCILPSSQEHLTTD